MHIEIPPSVLDDSILRHIGPCKEHIRGDLHREEVPLPLFLSSNFADDSPSAIMSSRERGFGESQILISLAHNREENKDQLRRTSVE